MDANDDQSAGISRATAVKAGAIGLLGGIAAVFGGTDAAEAATSDDSFTAVNNGSSDLGTGFQTEVGTGGHGYSVGGHLDGTEYGLWGSSLRGNGVYASCFGLAGGAGAAALNAAALGGGNAIYAESAAGFNNSTAEAIRMTKAAKKA